MVDLVGIQSNIVKIDQLISRTSGHLKPLKPHSDQKVSHWNLDGGHLSYRLAPLRKLGPAVGYANISGSICSFGKLKTKSLYNDDYYYYYWTAL